jgi:predicted amidohydrolase
MKVVMGQLNTFVGDVAGNTEQVIQAAQAMRAEDGTVLLVFPELTLTGYPPEDLLMRDSLHLQIESALSVLAEKLPPELYVIVGYPRCEDGRLFNAAGVIHNATLIAEYHKQRLPNYQVFDEKRYFQRGRCALCCRYCWHEGGYYHLRGHLASRAGGGGEANRCGAIGQLERQSIPPGEAQRALASACVAND